MIIWGTRGVTSVVSTGQFNCPQCADVRTYSLKQVRSFFTLYFIPLIPLNVAGRYIECHSCGGTFVEDVITYDPEKQRRETQDQMLRIMVMAALADGEVDYAEREEIRKQYLELTGTAVSADALEDNIALARSSGSNLNSYVGTMADSLTPHGKALVVKLAFQTMSASGELQAGHQQQLARLAQTLKIPQDQYKELIGYFSNPYQEEAE